MTTTIVRDPRLVDRRLQREFGTDRQCLVRIVKAAVAARAQANDDAPRSAASYYAWAEATTMLRQLFRRQGWDRNDQNGIETVDHHRRKIKIAVLSTDSGTCNDNRSPRNRTIKGAASEKLVDLNSQYELFRSEEMGPLAETQYTLWYLCIHDDGSDVRAELSRPIEFAAGYVSEFGERIFILQRGDWERVILEPSEDDEQQHDLLEIDVRRR